MFTDSTTATDYDEFTTIAYNALSLCPFEYDSDRWHAFHGYIENAMELDSWKFYADYTPEELAGAAAEADLG